MWQHAQDLPKFKPDQIPAWREEVSWEESPIPSLGAIDNRQFLERESVFSLDVTPVGIVYFSRRSHSSIWAA